MEEGGEGKKGEVKRSTACYAQVPTRNAITIYTSMHKQSHKWNLKEN